MLSALLLTLLSQAGMPLGYGANGLPFVTVADQVLTVDRTWYVNTSTGSDTGNDCRSLASPCATYPGAIAKIPKRIEGAAALVQGVAGQSYGGFQILNFDVTSSAAGVQGTLIVSGACGTSTLATGSASGTLTGATNASGNTDATATDSTATWTVNDLVGRWFRFSSGSMSTGPETRFQIRANTTTAVTLVGLIGGHAAGNTYVIEEPLATLGTRLEAETAGSTSAAWSAAVVRVVGNTSGSANANGSPIMVECFSFAPASAATGMQVESAAKVGVRFSKFSASVGTGVFVYGSTRFRAFSNYFNGVIGLNTINASPGAIINSNHFNLGSSGVFLGGNTGAFFDNNYFKGQTNAALAVNGSGQLSQSQVTRLRIDGAATGIQIVQTASNGGSPVALGLNGVDISNCTTAGIDLNGHNTSLWGTAITGTGNAIGTRIRFGAHAQFSASSTITGTIELVIDTTNTDLATMRAATPKALPTVAGGVSPYGTAIFE